MRHRLAHRNPSTLDCIFGIRLRPDPSACHLELDVDRDVVSPVDDIGEHLYSRSAEKVERRQEKLTMEHSYEPRPRKDKAASI